MKFLLSRTLSMMGLPSKAIVGARSCMSVCEVGGKPRALGAIRRDHN